MKSKMKHAISLIVLVVTILVLAILAAAVIISLSNANIMGQASGTVFKQDMANYKEEYEMYVISELAKDSDYDRNTLNVSYTDNKEVFEEIFGENVSDKYKEGLQIVKGKLVYVTGDETEKNILKELNISFTTGVLGVNLNGYKAGEWTNEDIVIVLEYSDLNDGKYQYKTNDMGWTDCEKTITIDTDQETMYYFRVVSSDETELAVSEGYEIKRDTVGPAFLVSAAHTESKKVYWTVSNVNDVGIGIEENFEITVSYKLTSASASKYAVAYTGSSLSGTISVSDKSSYTVKVEISDKLGNTRIVTNESGQYSQGFVPSISYKATPEPE